LSTCPKMFSSGRDMSSAGSSAAVPGTLYRALGLRPGLVWLPQPRGLTACTSTRQMPMSMTSEDVPVVDNHTYRWHLTNTIVRCQNCECVSLASNESAQDRVVGSEARRAVIAPCHIDRPAPDLGRSQAEEVLGGRWRDGSKGAVKTERRVLKDIFVLLPTGRTRVAHAHHASKPWQAVRGGSEQCLAGKVVACVEAAELALKKDGKSSRTMPGSPPRFEARRAAHTNSPTVTDLST
jgi:hypothetical protein